MTGRDAFLALSALVISPLPLAGLAAQETGAPRTEGGVDFANVEAECPEPVVLPEPRGHHQVGRVTYHWPDPEREEDLSEDPWDARQVLVDVFYPGLRDRPGPTASYIPELDLLRRGFGSDLREVPRRIGAGLERHGCVRTSAFPELPVDDVRERYPVLLFSPGGNMSRHWHTALAQELASEGWVVAVMSHAYSGLDVFPRGGFLMSSDRWEASDDASPGERARLDDELAGTLAGDAVFVLDRLEELDASDPTGRFRGRLDLERAAIAGHSRGGSTVGRACAVDERLRACVVFDNIGPDREVQSGLSDPQLSVRSPWSGERTGRLHGYLRRNDTTAYDVELEGAVHQSFSDLSVVEPERHPAELDAFRAHEITADVTLAFLWEQVGGRRTSGVRAAVAAHPEATLHAFGPGAGDSGDDAGARSSSGGRAGARHEGAERFAAARALADSLETDAYLLVREGRVVDAHGDTAREYRLHSVRKSLLGTLYGVAVRRGAADTALTLGALGIDDDAGLTSRERTATVRQLLQSRSGVYLPATHENPGFDDVRPARGGHAPGTRWFYSNWDFNAAGVAYQIMTGESVFTAFERDIARPLGMRDFGVEDGAWRYGARSRHPAYVFRMSARDLARFGRLMLQRGRWEGRQLVPEAWVDEITRRHSRATRPDGEPMPGVGYGMTWWVPPAEHHGVRLGPGAFTASGTGGQLLVVAPSRELVYVHRNDTDAPSSEYRDVSTSEAYRILELLLSAEGGGS